MYIYTYIGAKLNICWIPEGAAFNGESSQTLMLNWQKLEGKKTNIGVNTHACALVCK